MKISLAVLLVALALAASSQSDCLVNQNSLWIQNELSAFVECSGAEFGSTLSWWAVSDPCQNGPSSSITSLQCSGGTCSVGSDVYGRPDTTSCHVCCTNGATFTPEAIISCTAINVCPTVRVEVPRLAKTGGRVEVLTFVLTKPPPPPGTVTVTAKTAANSTNLTVEGDGNVYSDPFAPNSYVFSHVVELPIQKASTDDRVLYTVDQSAIPHGERCTSESTVVRSTNLIEVDVTATTATTTTTGTPTAKDITSSGVSPSIDGLTPEPSGGLNIVSLLVGIGVGVVSTLVVAGVVAVVIALATRRKCACSYRKKKSMESRSHHNSSNGGERPLLTSNGTPATTPSSDVQRSLGQTSDSTPASTPTDPNELLLTTQQSQTSDASPYEEVKPSNFQSAAIQLDRQRLAANAPPMGSGAPPPQEPAPPPPVPPLRPKPPRLEQTVLQSSEPGYMKQHDMAMMQIYLSSNRNNGDSLV